MSDEMAAAPLGLGVGAILSRAGRLGTGSRTAITWKDQRITYEALSRRSAELARELQRDGLRAGDRVCLLADNRPEWLEFFFAVVVAGGIVIPINYYSSAEELAHMLRDSAATWLVFESRYERLVASCNEARHVRQVVVDDRSRDRPGMSSAAIDARSPVRATGAHPGFDDTVVMQYTSGTSGQAKAAVHTHSTILWNALHQISDLSIDATSVTLVVPSMSWSAGLHDLTLATLWQAGRVVLFPRRRFDPGALLKTIERERVSHVFLAPSVLRRLVVDAAEPTPDLSSLTVVLTGGEQLSSSLVQQLAERFGPLPLRPSYGLTEFPSTMLLMPPLEVYSRPGSVGLPTLISEVRIVDEHGLGLPPGEAGEIICRSPATMRGYHNDVEGSARALKGGWLYTGDLGLVDDDGFYHVVGRKKDMLISGGLNVYPAEVEQALEEHHAVVEAAVVAQADDVWGEIPKAHVVVRPDQPVTSDELQRFLEARLSSYKVPKVYVLHDRPLPRSVSGKVVKKML